MKQIILTLIFFVIGFFSLAQNETAEDKIKKLIIEDFNKWLIKSQFETQKKYEERINIKSQKVLDSISKVEYIQYCQNSRPHINFLNYDAENKLVPIILTRHVNSWSTEEDLGYVDTIYLKIKEELAPFVMKNISNDLINISEYKLINNQCKVSKAFFFFTGIDRIEAIDIIDNKIVKKRNWSYNLEQLKNISELTDKEIKKFLENRLLYFDRGSSIHSSYDFYYFYDEKVDDFSTKNEALVKSNFNINIEDLKINLPQNQSNQKINFEKSTNEPELAISLMSKNRLNNDNTIAVIIGNSHYEKTKKVTFAINDVRTIKEYLINILGYKEGNILHEEDLKKSGFELLFGTGENPQAKLANIIKPGVSDVFVYYSGHGAPGLKDNKGYFVPVDCDPNYIEQTGYSLDLFYRNLAKLNAKSVTVVTDACFSGAELFNNISPITINISNPFSVQENCVIFSSSTGSQVSSWFNEKKHGLFTYYFLRAFQDIEKSDTNKDNKLTYKEIADYVSDKTNGVPYMARKLHNVDQNPTIQGSGVDNVFIEFK